MNSGKYTTHFPQEYIVNLNTEHRTWIEKLKCFKSTSPAIAGFIFDTYFKY